MAENRRGRDGERGGGGRWAGGPGAIRPRTIQLVIAGGLTYGRSIARGVLAYARIHPEWRVVTSDVTFLERVRMEGMDGLIIHASSVEFLEFAERQTCPVINVSGQLETRKLARVLPDDRGIGRLVARHLMARGFRNFGYWGILHHGYSDRRAKGFREEIEGNGYAVLECPLVAPGVAESGQTAAVRAMRKEWLRDAPKPFGVMACSDGRAGTLCGLVRELGLRMPEDVALVGVDNDELLTEAAGISLSSVDIGADRIGFAAAELLDEMIDGAKAPTTPVLIAPLGVVARHSSDMLAVSDEQVALAMRFVQQRATMGIGVDDVAEATVLSRRVLERRFRKETGRTIHEEIRRVQMEKARELLASSDLSIKEVAKVCGFSVALYLSSTFRKEHGMTPRDYRRQFQKR